MSIAVNMGAHTKVVVPLATKRAMRAAHLLGRMLKDHFDENSCELMTEKSFDWRSYSLNILDNLMLVGGIPRDILLGTEVKDIDITFNLRELTKIQLNHLRKYHSSKSSQSQNIRCAYWQHYLNKFDPDNEAEEARNQQEKNQMIRFHNCSYIFNARYFVDILADSPALHGRVQVSDISRHGFIGCTIIDHIDHESYDLLGQKFEFTDTFDERKALTVQKLMQQESLSQQNLSQTEQKSSGMPSNGSGQRTRWKSIALFPQNIDFVAEFDAELKPVDIEVYPIKVRDKLACYDFSINTAVIPMSSITEFCDSEDEVNIAIWFWEYIVENGLDEVDAMKDIKLHRVLRVPQPEKELYIIRIHPTTYHFWRTIELMIRLPNFYIDTPLIAAHIEDYDGWLHAQYFAEERNRTAFVARFRQIVTEYCRDVDDVRAMLHTLQTLQFNDRFTEILGMNKDLGKDLMMAIQDTDNQQILVIFSSYGYPFLYGLGPQSGGDTQEEQVSKKEVLRLKNINVQLQKENGVLKDEVERLQTDKKVLAQNSSEAIQQLREYLLVYQSALMNGKAE